MGRMGRGSEERKERTERETERDTHRQTDRQKRERDFLIWNFAGNALLSFSTHISHRVYVVFTKCGRLAR